MSVRRAQALTVSFAAIDATRRPLRRSGVAFAPGDIQISRDGADFVDITAPVSEIGMSGRYQFGLTAAEMDASWVHVKIEKSGLIDPIDIQIGTDGSPSGTVQADAGNNATVFKTDLASSVDDFWKDCLIVFTSGALQGQVKKVITYIGATKTVTVGSAFTATPSTGDRFVLVNI
ncbi:MAG: hypothetical protein HYX72_13610 [Acidobacteria bacterium]|nr:hypothetical protein [Acidobacteriota bacterium]